MKGPASTPYIRALSGPILDRESQWEYPFCVRVRQKEYAPPRRFERRFNMKSSILLSFALLLGPIALAAQTTNYGEAGMEGLTPSQASAPTNAAQVTVFQIPPANLGCPVSLRAQHGSDGTMVQTDKSRPKGTAQLLHLTLIDPHPDSARMVSARMSVHGLSGVVRATPALSGSGVADATQTLEVRFSSGSEKAAFGNLWVPGMTAVLSIDLKSVTYADGSTRSFSGREACHVAPDLMMLVAGH
jgi:hypothetical protein